MAVEVRVGEGARAEVGVEVKGLGEVKEGEREWDCDCEREWECEKERGVSGSYAKLKKLFFPLKNSIKINYLRNRPLYTDHFDFFPVVTGLFIYGFKNPVGSN